MVQKAGNGFRTRETKNSNRIADLLVSTWVAAEVRDWRCSTSIDGRIVALPRLLARGMEVFAVGVVRLVNSLFSPSSSSLTVSLLLPLLGLFTSGSATCEAAHPFSTRSLVLHLRSVRRCLLRQDGRC